MKPRKPLTLTLAVTAILAAAGFSPSASAELTSREASIVPIAAFTANGNQEQLKKALAKGLDNGLTVNEIKAVLEQMYAYTGFPRSLTVLGVYVKLLDELKAAGLKDTVGREPTPLPQGTDLLQIGTKTQTELVGYPVAGPVYTFSPISTRTSRITSSAPSLQMTSSTGASGNSPPFRLSRPFRPQRSCAPT